MKKTTASAEWFVQYFCKKKEYKSFFGYCKIRLHIFLNLYLIICIYICIYFPSQFVFLILVFVLTLVFLFIIKWMAGKLLLKSLTNASTFKKDQPKENSFKIITNMKISCIHVFGDICKHKHRI